MPFRLALILSIITTTSYAQVRSANKVETILTNQLQEYSDDYDELITSRGYDPSQELVTRKKLQDAIAYYSGDQAFSFLFYHFDNDTLYHWLLNSTGRLVRASRIRVTYDSLLSLEYTVKRDFWKDNALATRSASRAALTTQVKRYRIETPECIDLISAILLPSNITEGLQGTQYLVIVPSLNIAVFPFAMLKPWKKRGGHLIDSMSYSFLPEFTQFFDNTSIRDRYNWASFQTFGTPTALTGKKALK